MISKTEAIVLRVRPFSNTSRMVTWLSPEYGRVTTSIKGACRVKSFFQGQIDLAYRCELLFYSRERNGIHIARETYVEDWRAGIRGNWRASVAASYICWLTAQSTQPMIDCPGLFDDLETALHSLDRGVSPQEVIISYEMMLLDRLGIAPSFARCRDCPPGNTFECRFLLASGHLGCTRSPDHGAGEASVAIPTRLLGALADMQRIARSSSAAGYVGSDYLASLHPSAVTGIRRFLGLFICHQLDVSPRTRYAAFDWLAVK